MARVRFVLFGPPVLGWALAACTPEPPPALAGLWSVGEAACAQARGLSFDAKSVTAHVEGQSRPLLEGVRYELRAERGGLFVRLRHDLPARPGGVDPRGGQAVVDLRLGADGWLRPVARRFEDGLTGSARVRLHDLGYAEALNVRSCARPWPQRPTRAPAKAPGGLRGRVA
jgi:hypothetical protein